MAAKNDITGDAIQTKGILSKQAEANWDLIFGKKECQVCSKDLKALKECAEPTCPHSFEV